MDCSQKAQSQGSFISQRKIWWKQRFFFYDLQVTLIFQFYTNYLKLINSLYKSGRQTLLPSGNRNNWCWPDYILGTNFVYTLKHPNSFPLRTTFSPIFLEPSCSVSLSFSHLPRSTAVQLFRHPMNSESSTILAPFSMARARGPLC